MENIAEYTEDSESDSEVELEDVETTAPPSDPRDQIKLFLKASAKGHLEWIVKLMEVNSDLLNCQDDDGYSALHRSSYSEKPEIVQYLLSNGAHIDIRTNDQWTPLHSAARWDSWNCIKILLENGADINVQTNGGHTPLHLACQHKAQKSATILLLHKDLDINLRNNSNETAHDLARRCSKFSYLFELQNKVINILE